MECSNHSMWRPGVNIHLEVGNYSVQLSLVFYNRYLYFHSPSVEIGTYSYSVI